MTTERTILSLDLGSNCGWCLFTAGGAVIQSGVLPFKASEGHHPGHRWCKFQNFLMQHRTVTEIMYEHVPGFQGAHAAYAYCGMLAVLQLFCLVQRIRLTGIKPKSVKKEFAGNGNADKQAMCRTAHRLGWKHGHPETDIDHDEADSIAIGWVLLKRRNVEPSFQRV